MKKGQELKKESEEVKAAMGKLRAAHEEMQDEVNELKELELELGKLKEVEKEQKVQMMELRN